VSFSPALVRVALYAIALFDCVNGTTVVQAADIAQQYRSDGRSITVNPEPAPIFNRIFES
jgi:hypothetical protein